MLTFDEVHLRLTFRNSVQLICIKIIQLYPTIKWKKENIIKMSNLERL